MLNNVRLLVEIAVGAGLATGLSLLTLFRMPQGGSITLVMLPLFFVALRYGAGVGVITGLLVGTTQYLVGGFFIHPLQLLLDYPIAFAAVGLSGALRGVTTAAPLPAILFGGGARFLTHFVSGMVFFGKFAPEGQPIWAYAAIYNAAYLIPETILCALLLPPLLKRMEKKHGENELQ